jgi:nitrite reductase (NADH) large subunit
MDTIAKAKKKLVVVGGGMAGMCCVEEVLKLDPDRYEITVLSGEEHLNYNRVLLSQVLRGEKKIEELYLHGREWYEENNIRLVTGCRVESINRPRRTVIGTGGVEAQYDKLVLATGSVPRVPPIPGIDKAGVVSFRDVKDCEKIKGLLEGEGQKAVVIGGGLLGLEAAYSLKTLGADVTVAHLLDRLMEIQLDTVSAGYLAEDLEKLGIKVLLNVKTVELTGGDTVAGVRFADGSSVKADLVVVSTGIRPNTELARSAGIYCEKGIVVSDVMQTFDPAVYAIGECVEHRGATFGLVASVFDQARVLASHLAGDARLVFGQKPASTRLKIPGVNLYCAGSIAETEGVESVEYRDMGSRVYKKLFLKENRITGIVLYGDAALGPELFMHLCEGSDVTDKRGGLLFGGGAAVTAAASVDAIPDDAIVCGCNGVTKGMIVEAIEKKGLFTREEVRNETNASGSCGGCSGLVDRLLERVLGSSFEGQKAQAGICTCTKYTRDDVIKNIRERRLKTVQEVMDTLGWESVGCDTCRPALNYYLSMVWPREAVDDPGSRLINERVHANIQKDKSFSVIPRVYGGVIAPEELKRIADAAVKFDVPLVKITGGQRIGLYGLKKEELPKVWKEIGMPSGYAYAKALRTVKTCVGERFCRYGTQDSLGLGVKLEKRLAGLWMPAKVKLGVTGCPRDCAEIKIKDVGIKGVAGGFDLHVGGCGGIELAGGEILASVKTEEEAVELVCAFIQLYREEAEYGVRAFKWVRRTGLGTIKKAIVEDAGRRKRLVIALDEARAGLKDPWGAGGGGAAGSLEADVG